MWARLCVWVGAVVMVLSGGSVAVAKALISRYEGSVNHANLLGSGNGKSHATISGAFNYLLLGSDVRAGDTTDTQGRSDTIMVFHVAKDHQSAYLVSLPRDLWVHIDQCGKKPDGGCMDKLNSAYQYAGPTNTAKTVSALTGIDFQGMAIINFYSFDKIIDAIGGVDMCVDEDVVSHHTSHTFTRGCHHFTGPVALDYVRQRYGLAQGDFDRQRHQQQLIKAAVQQVKKQNITTDPIKMDKIVRLAGNDLTVDTRNVPLVDLAFSLRNLGTSDITMLRLPEVDGFNNGGESIQELDDRGKSLFQALQTDTLDQWALQHSDLVNHDAAL